MAARGAKYNGDRKVCHFFNTPGGCWNGERCRFQHVKEKKPVCRFFGTEKGCKYGNDCFYRHVAEDENSNDDKKNEEIDEAGAARGKPVQPSKRKHKKQAQKPDKDASDDDSEDPGEEELFEYPGKVICGECKWEYEHAELIVASDALESHYKDKFAAQDQQHLSIFSTDKHFINKPFMCGVCGMGFKKAVEMLQHLKSESENKSEDDDHKMYFDDIVGNFVSRDIGTNSAKSTIQVIALEMVEPGYNCDSEDSDEEDLNFAAKFGYHLRRSATLTEAEREAELEERMENGGFLEEELEELMCQGIKPWEDCAWSALDILYDF